MNVWLKFKNGVCIPHFGKCQTKKIARKVIAWLTVQRDCPFDSLNDRVRVVFVIHVRIVCEMMHELEIVPQYKRNITLDANPAIRGGT